MKLLQWMKKYLLIIILISSLCACIDYNLVKQKNNPLFAFLPIYNVEDIIEKDYYRIHVGPLYYIKVESGDDSDTAIKDSGYLGIGIWFLPSITIYER